VPFEAVDGLSPQVRKLMRDFEREFGRTVQVLREAEASPPTLNALRAARCLPRIPDGKFALVLVRDAPFPDRAIARELARGALCFRHGYGRMHELRSAAGLKEKGEGISDLAQDWFVDMQATEWGFPWTQNERRAFAVGALARLHASKLPKNAADLASVYCGVVFESAKRCSLTLSGHAHSEAKRSFLALLAEKSPVSYVTGQRTVRILRPYVSVVEGRRFAKVLGQVAALFGLVRGADYDIVSPGELILKSPV
jgi:hypothetical protein